MTSTDPTLAPIRLWDLPTRLFHWALVVLIALQFATAEFGWLSMDWHYRFGYATLALIAFRVAWGFVGSQTSRFADFVRGPISVARYLRAAASTQARPSAGHNPLGGWSVLAMLAAVALQAVSGLFASDEIDADGPFVDAVSAAMVKWMTRLHHWGETALLVLIGLHISAVLLHGLLKRDNLIAPMLTGRKRIDAPQPTFVSAWRAALLFAIALAAVMALSRFGA
jgi:cytochrome b